MVNGEAREAAATALSRFLAGETTNEEFDAEYSALAVRWKRHTDRAIGAVYGFAWNLYDDFSTHKLEGAFALEDEVRVIAERCLLFLRSGYEYEWRRAKFIGIDWRRIAARFLPWVKWEEDAEKRLAQFLNEPSGDAAVWPFYRHEDYALSLHR